MKTCMEKLASFAASIDCTAVPSSVLEKAKLCTMDALECCLSPMTDERVAAALASIPEGGDCTLIATGRKACAADAAYYNTVKGSVTNRNDLQLDSAAHLGAVIVPTVLAIAEERHLSGREFLSSVLAGYEATARYGRLFMGRIHSAWRTTAVFAPVGCALSAAKALDLEEGGIMSAGSIAANSSSGFNEWAGSGTGEDVFQNGNSAKSGIFSALLAMNGASGCPTVLEGPDGLGAAFGIREGFETLEEGCGEKWMIQRVIHKPLECCIIVQAPSQVAEGIRKEHPELILDDVREIRIHMEEKLIHHAGCANKEIHTLVHAIMSIAYGVSSALASGSAGTISWMPPVSPEVSSLMGKCSFVPRSEGGAPLSAPVEIEVEMKDGRIFSREDRFHPLGEEEVRERFFSTSSRRLGEEKARELFSLLMDLENVEDMNAITRLMA